MISYLLSLYYDTEEAGRGKKNALGYYLLTTNLIFNGYSLLIIYHLLFTTPGWPFISVILNIIWFVNFITTPTKPV